MPDINKKLKSARKNLGLTQAEVANKARSIAKENSPDNEERVSQGLISKLENYPESRSIYLPELMEALDLIVVDKYAFSPERIMACMQRIEAFKNIFHIYLTTEDTAKAISLMARAIDADEALEDLTDFIKDAGVNVPLSGDERAIRVALEAVNQVAADKGIPAEGLTKEQRDRAFLVALNTLKKNK